jgi:predicted transcriptional regulator
MPKISTEKQQKIAEQTLFYLYSIFPKQIFTSDVARELARDEEFMKKILDNLEQKELIVKITKNPKGKTYSKRSRWRISNKAYEIYNKANR